jgi:hypothetical protein
MHKNKTTLECHVSWLERNSKTLKCGDTCQEEKRRKMK